MQERTMMASLLQAFMAFSVAGQKGVRIFPVFKNGWISMSH
jgi:hypothetical protein